MLHGQPVDPQPKLAKDRMDKFNKHFPQLLALRKEQTQQATSGFSPEELQLHEWTFLTGPEHLRDAISKWMDRKKLVAKSKGKKSGQGVSLPRTAPTNEELGAFRSIGIDLDLPPKARGVSHPSVQTILAQLYLDFGRDFGALKDHKECNGGEEWDGSVPPHTFAGEMDEIPLGDTAKKWCKYWELLQPHMRAMLEDVGYDLSKHSYDKETLDRVNKLKWDNMFAHAVKYKADNGGDEWNGNIPSLLVIQGDGGSVIKLGKWGDNQRASFLMSKLPKNLVRIN